MSEKERLRLPSGHSTPKPRKAAEGSLWVSDEGRIMVFDGSTWKVVGEREIIRAEVDRIESEKQRQMV